MTSAAGALPPPPCNLTSTARKVRLREFVFADVPMVVDLSTDPYVPTIGTLPLNADEAAARVWIEGQRQRRLSGAGYSLCVAKSDDDQAVGQVGLWLAARSQGRASLGYFIGPAHRGHGYAGEALDAAARFAWTLDDLHRLELYVEPWNVASQRTAERAQFVREGLLRSHQEIDGRRVDMFIYASIRAGLDVPNG